jgi:endonuclease G, mitochondrial
MPPSESTAENISQSPNETSGDDAVAAIPIDATEERFQARELARKAASHAHRGLAAPMSFSIPMGGNTADASSGSPKAGERKLFREGNDPARIQKLLKRRGMSDDKIRRLIKPPPFSFSILPDDDEPVSDRELGFERILGNRELVDSWFLEAGARAARAVGRIQISTAGGHPKGYGTGSLIGPRLLLTNHHVLPDEAQAAKSLVEFGIDADAFGRDRSSEIFSLRPDLFFLTDAASGDGLDFTLVAVEERGTENGDLGQFGWNSAVIEDDDPILVRQYVNIIQHPKGLPKQVALRDNQVTDLLPHFLHYRAGTEPGSSGAPVFNDYWELVGLHHSGVPRRDPKTNEVLTRWGAVWDRKNERDVDWIANEGVRLSQILIRLKAATLGGDATRLRNSLFSAEPGSLPRIKSQRPRPAAAQEQAPAAIDRSPAPPLISNIAATASNEAPFVASVTVSGGSASVTIPLQIQLQVRILEPVILTTAQAPASPAQRPRPDVSESEPASEFEEAVSIDPDYSGRLGYNPEFLGKGSLRVDLPKLPKKLAKSAALVTAPAPAALPFELKYHHYSAVMHSTRHLAIFTAVNIEGDRDQHLTRESDKWIRDPRIDPLSQIGNEFYKHTPFDRGHLVRRIDPAWGSNPQLAKVANDDTYHFTNCAPQHRDYNRGLELWRGLEDFLIERALEGARRITVFTGPLFDRDGNLNVAEDPDYAGVLVPRWYWKVAVLVRPGGTLGALGFLVSQSKLVDRAVADLQEQEAAVDVAATFQVPVARIVELTGLDFGQLAGSEAPTVAGFGNEASLGDDSEILLRSKDEIRIPWA